MPVVMNRKKAPNHLFNIPELDVSDDLFAERLSGPWLRLAAWTSDRRRDKSGVEEEISRQSFLLKPEQFAAIYTKLESVGNVIHGMGQPGGSVLTGTEGRKYAYHAFHQFQLPFTSVLAEPLVFRRFGTSSSRFFINPDLWLFVELEERTPGQGIWWDPRRGVEALVYRKLEQINLEAVEIRPDYLLKYLRERQMSLIIGHYRQLLLYSPSQKAVESFVEKDVVLGSREQGTKAVLQNWGLRKDVGRTPFLQRRLHLWLEIKPPEIDIEDPWAEQPSFDPYTFTLPTRAGQVAPARWRSLRNKNRKFSGESCDFLETIYFRQEVLRKYEGASGFEVSDNGDVSCGGYWALNRSTSRIGNELLSTYIGDF